MASISVFALLSIFALGLFTAAGFSVELIHRDHPKSPFYNPTFSRFDRLHATARRSHARAKALHRAFFSHAHTHVTSLSSTTYTNSPSPLPSDSSFPSPADSPLPYPPSGSPSPDSSNVPIEADIIANSFDYLISVRLGSPSRQIIAIADTGSDLIWVTCKPCSNCYQQDAPLFDPANSSSYATFQCSSKQCNQLPSSLCDDYSSSSSKCIYQYTYGDGSQTIGNLAKETVTFKTTSGSSVGFPGVAFGCSHVANGTFERHSAGLVGLGGGPLSLVSQLGSSIEHRFSYCLVPYALANVNTSQLNFGSDALISGDDVQTTGMVDFKETFYTLTLDGITVGENSTVDSIPRSYMIVDSGTTMTYLDSTVLQSLVKILVKNISLPQVEDSQKLFPLCFNESHAESDFMYPEITLQLGQATVTLKPYNTFVKTTEKVRCLAMASNDGISGVSLSILGNIAQQNLHVGFDLASRKISFSPADCTKY